MQTLGTAALRLVYLAPALQSHTALGFSEARAGLHDEVSFVQQRMNYTTNLGPELDASAQLGPQFRLEDAEAFFNLGMNAVSAESTGPSLEEKGIALLQNLAEHHSVAGTATQETLKKAAASMKSELDERLLTESQTKVPPEWVEITDGSDGQPGICWNWFGGKPLQCEVERQMIPKDKGEFANPCEALCAEYDWCSGYGWGKRRVPRVVNDDDDLGGNDNVVMEDVCLLMSNGAEPCPHSWVTYGLIASVSSRDFKVYPVGSDVGEPGSNFPYRCTAKYSAPTSRVIVPNRFEFEQLAPVPIGKTGKKTQGAKCAHVDDVPLHECKVKVDDFWEVDQKGFKFKNSDDEITWPNKCEKICAGLEWCTAYSYYKGSQWTYHNVAECYLHSNRDDGCPDGLSWEKTINPDARPAITMDDVKPDPKGSSAPGKYGEICRVKAASWRGKFQQMFRPGPDTAMCKISDGMMIAQSVMAVTSLLANIECYRQSTLPENQRLAHPTTPSASHLLDEHSLENVSRGFKNWSLSKKGRTALTQILSREEGTKLSGLRVSKGFNQARCYVQTSSAGMRWTLGSLGNYFEKQYQCVEDQDPAFKATMYCRSSLLRTVGRGLFGAGLYGFTAIKQNCGAEPVELTKFFCGLDYGKLVLYVGKVIFHVLQLAFFLNADQAWEKASTAMNVAGANIFIGEAIVRIMGPCLGVIRNDKADTVIKDGTCLGTYLEEAALGVQTTSAAVQAYNYCVTKQ